jgi:hypothetical protein
MALLRGFMGVIIVVHRFLYVFKNYEIYFIKNSFVNKKSLDK